MYHKLGCDLNFKVFRITLSLASARRDKAPPERGSPPDSAPPWPEPALPPPRRQLCAASAPAQRGTAQHSTAQHSFVANFKAVTHLKLNGEFKSTTKLSSPFCIPCLLGLSVKRNPREHSGVMTAAPCSHGFFFFFRILFFLSPSLSLVLPLVLVPYAQYLPSTMCSPAVGDLKIQR